MDILIHENVKFIINMYSKPEESINTLNYLVSFPCKAMFPLQQWYLTDKSQNTK